MMKERRYGRGYTAFLSVFVKTDFIRNVWEFYSGGMIIERKKRGKNHTV